MRKVFFALIAVLTSLFMNLQLVSPAVSTTPSTETGDIYYWGAWDNATNGYLGLRRYNLDSGTDQKLGTGSQSCAPLIGAPSGIAVDPSHNRIYWSINDGNVGVFAMDLSTGTCFTISNDSSVFGLEIVPATQTLIWGARNGSQVVNKTVVSNLANIPTPTSLPTSIQGLTAPTISDIVLVGNKLYYLVWDGTISIYSSSVATPGAGFTLEKATPIPNSSGQLGVTNDYFYFSIDGLQVVRAQRNGTDIAGFLDTNIASGFAVTANKMYSIKDRDTILKSIPLTATNQVMTDLPGNARPDIFTFLRYSPTAQAGLAKPTITASNSKTTSGVARVPFSGVTIRGSKKLYFNATPTDNSTAVQGYCTVAASKCVISGLADDKEYNVQLAATYTYLDGSNVIPTIASEPSNIAKINQAGVITTSNNKTFRGFEFERARLIASIKTEIADWVTTKTGVTKATCTGYTGFNYHHRSKASLKRLAVKRATNVCNYIKSQNSGITKIEIRSVNESGKKASTRRVKVKLSH